MVFLNKHSYTDTMSTATSFTKNKVNLKDKSISIFDFTLGRKLGAGKFG
jgi:hypothetical protein